MEIKNGVGVKVVFASLLKSCRKPNVDATDVDQLLDLLKEDLKKDPVALTHLVNLIMYWGKPKRCDECGDDLYGDGHMRSGFSESQYMCYTTCSACVKEEADSMNE